MKRKITGVEYDRACEMMYQLTEILLSAGIVEIKISKKEREIYWDTEGGGKIDPLELDRFSSLINKYWMEIAQRTMER